ncbi:transposase [Sorangium sp. So ce118]
MSLTMPVLTVARAPQVARLLAASTIGRIPLGAAPVALFLFARERWRRRLAQDGALFGVLTRIFVESVERFYEERAARRGACGAVKSGAVTAVQRTSGDMRLNPHLHVVFLDGGYHEDGTELVWNELGHLPTRAVGQVPRAPGGAPPRAAARGGRLAGPRRPSRDQCVVDPPSVGTGSSLSAGGGAAGAARAAGAAAGAHVLPSACSARYASRTASRCLRKWSVSVVESVPLSSTCVNVVPWSGHVTPLPSETPELSRWHPAHDWVVARLATSSAEKMPFFPRRTSSAPIRARRSKLFVSWTW